MVVRTIELLMNILKKYDDKYVICTRATGLWYYYEHEVAVLKAGYEDVRPRKDPFLPAIRRYATVWWEEKQNREVLALRHLFLDSL